MEIEEIWELERPDFIPDTRHPWVRMVENFSSVDLEQFDEALAQANGDWTQIQLYRLRMTEDDPAEGKRQFTRITREIGALSDDQLRRYLPEMSRAQAVACFELFYNLICHPTNLDKLIKVIEKNYRHFPEDSPLYIEMTNAEAFVHWQAGRFKEAAEAYGEIEEIYARGPDRWLHAEALYMFGAMLWRAEYFSDAEEALGQAQTLLESLGDQRSAGVALMERANTFTRDKRGTQGLECAEQAVARFAFLGDQKLEALALGIAAELEEDPGRCLEFQSRRRAIYEALQDYDGLSKTIRDTGNYLEDWGRYTDAIDMYEESLAVARNAGVEIDLVTVYAMYLDTLILLGRSKAAQKVGRQGLKAAREEYPFFEIMFLARLGLLEFDRGDQAAARKLADEANQKISAQQDEFYEGFFEGEENYIGQLTEALADPKRRDVDSPWIRTWWEGVTYPPPALFVQEATGFLRDRGAVGVVASLEDRTIYYGDQTLNFEALYQKYCESPQQIEALMTQWWATAPC